MQPDRPAALDGAGPDGTSPDGSGLTDRQRQAFGSLGDRLARLPAGHPSAPGYRAATQDRQKLPNDSPVADVPPPGEPAPVADARERRRERAGAGQVTDAREVRGERPGVAGLVPGARDGHAGGADGLGGRLAWTVAAGETARKRRTSASGRSAGRDAAGRVGATGRAVGDPAGWPVIPGMAGRREAYRPWFYGSGEPWFSAGWAGTGAGWF